MWTTTTILMCLWAIGLEIALRKRTNDLRTLVRTVNMVAVGDAKIIRRDDQTVIVINKEKWHGCC